MRHALLVGLVALFASGATASAQSVPERLADLRLTTAVRLALVADPMTRPLNVGVAARRGAVELTSEAGGRARDVLRVVQAVPGVQSVSGLGIELDAPASPTVTMLEPPAGEESAEEDGPVYHTIQSGETLFSLARRYETTVDAILALNNRESTAIRIGERLRVR